jgi:hypothetical protein
LKESASFGDCYRFFDANVFIKSDSFELLEFFRQTYRHFLIDDIGDGQESHSYYVLANNPTRYGPLLLKDDNKAFSLLEGEALPDSADALIFGSITNKIKSHFMIHGAAVSSDGEGLVFSGLSGSGKTTLALELTRRGFLFFSDEIAAFSRSTRLVHPFPRAIGTRENSVKLLEKIDFLSGKLRPTVGGETKWMVDIEDIFASSISPECPGRYLFLLDTTLEDGGSAKKEHHIIDVALKAVDHDLITKLNAIDGIEQLSLDFDGKFDVATFKVRKNKGVQMRFHKVCKEFDNVILYKVKTLESPPNSTLEPRLFPVSTMEAGMELLGNLQNIAVTDDWMSRAPSLNVSQTLLELVEMITGMKCYRLVVGNLSKTADLISDQLARK